MAQFQRRGEPATNNTARRIKRREVSSRSIAYELLNAVDRDDAYANLLLPKLLDDNQLSSRDSAFCQELAFGTLRMRGFYDSVIEECANRSVSEIDYGALNLLRLGSHQLLGMRVPAHAALSETVNQARAELSLGSVGFVNGVLRRVSERSREDWLEIVTSKQTDANEALAREYSHPAWIIKAFRKALESDELGDQLNLLLEADNIAPLVSLVALPGLSTVDDLLDEGCVLGTASPIGVELPGGEPSELHLIRTGQARVQDQGSQLAALALIASKEVTPNEEWLDLCAGPGGKAALLAAAAMEVGAELVCNEISDHRAVLVEKALARVNPKVYVRVGDGRDLGDEAPEGFDRILLDAPCSGLGALRRRPEARWRKSVKDVAELTKLQEELFDSAWAGLKPGGVLAYVTCSPHLAETTAIVERAQHKLGGTVTLLDAVAVLKQLNPALRLNTKRKTVQLWPQIHGTDAMFIALLQKVEVIEPANDASPLSEN
jgi:16S rRNA (cytosine967-C5)-methyltransferase